MVDPGMPLTATQLADELAGPVGEALVSAARIGSVTPFGKDKQVVGQTFTFLVRSSEGAAAAVVLCSPEVSPGLIAQSMTLARQAREALGPELGIRVLEPIAEGEVRGLSYAVLPYCEPLSEKRLTWWRQRRRIRPLLLDWLMGLTRRTMRDVSEADKHTRFIRPLAHLSELVGASDAVRSAAKRGLERLQRNAWRPRFVLAHNDLWKGNVLLDKHGGFLVIDWPGAALDGYAIYDLARLAESFRVRGASLTHQVLAHCRVLGCEPTDALSHLAAGLGHLSQNLDNFPMRRFLPMADGCVNRVASAVGHPH